MNTRRVTNLLLVLIFGALVAIWTRLPSTGTALAEDDTARRPVFGDYVGFAVDNSGLYLLEPGRNHLFHYNQQGRLLQTYEIRALGEDFKVSYGRRPGG